MERTLRSAFVQGIVRVRHTLSLLYYARTLGLTKPEELDTTTD